MWWGRRNHLTPLCRVQVAKKKGDLLLILQQLPQGPVGAREAWSQSAAEGSGSGFPRPGLAEATERLSNQLTTFRHPVNGVECPDIMFAVLFNCCLLGLLSLVLMFSDVCVSVCALVCSVSLISVPGK